MSIDELRITNFEALALLDQLDLQWFAPEDEGRTEDATEHKIKKAREDGKVAKSPDVASAIVLLFCVVGLGLFGKNLLKSIIGMVDYFIGEESLFSLDGPSNVIAVMGLHFIKIVLPIVLIAFISAIIGNVIQFGFNFSTKPIIPDPKKIVPKFGKFFQKSFMSSEALFNLGKALFKVFVIFSISFANIWFKKENLAGLLGEQLIDSFSFLVQLIFAILLEASVALLVLAIPDFFFQKKQHMDSLKMTKQEIKQEHKEMDGDPLIKQKMKERMREIMSGNMIQNVPNADVVITNPTHYAIALEYDRDAMAAPIILAKGEDRFALRMRELARDNDVPLVENKPLARALYDELNVGDEIPQQYYEAIATVLRTVYELNGMVEEAV